VKLYNGRVIIQVQNGSAIISRCVWDNNKLVYHFQPAENWGTLAQYAHAAVRHSDLDKTDRIIYSCPEGISCLAKWSEDLKE
jgi:hypothetical protein